MSEKRGSFYAESRDKLLHQAGIVIDTPHFGRLLRPAETRKVDIYNPVAGLQGCTLDRCKRGMVASPSMHEDYDALAVTIVGVVQLQAADSNVLVHLYNAWRTDWRRALKITYKIIKFFSVMQTEIGHKRFKRTKET